MIIPCALLILASASGSHGFPSGDQCSFWNSQIDAASQYSSMYSPASLIISDEDRMILERAIDQYFGDNIDWEELESLNFTEYYIKENIKEQANDLADEMAQDLLELRRGPLPRQYSISDYAVSEREMTRFEIEFHNALTESSLSAVTYIDISNIVMNIGSLVDTSSDFYTQQRFYQPYIRDWIGLKMQIYQYVNQIPFIMRQELRPLTMDDAECIYQAASQSKNRVVKTFTSLVTKEKFLEYAELVLKAIARREDIGIMLRSLYTEFGKKVDELDYNRISMSLYYNLIQLRKIALDVDVKDLLRSYNKLIHYLEDAQKKIWSGEWDFVDKIMDNYIRKTLGGPSLWKKADDLYQKYLIDMKQEFVERRKDLTIEMENSLEGVGAIIRTLAEEDYDVVVERFRSSKWLERTVRSLGHYLEYFASYISSYNLSCYLLHPLPSRTIEDLEEAFAVLLVDWEDADDWMKRLNDISSKVMDVFNDAVTRFFGTC